MSIIHSEEDPTITKENLTCLANHRRRKILAVLQEQETPVDRRDLAEEVAAAEKDATPDTVSDQVVKKVLLTLHHNHLPRLDNAGFLTYDRQQYRITSQLESESAERVLGEL